MCPCVGWLARAGRWQSSPRDGEEGGHGGHALQHKGEKRVYKGTTVAASLVRLLSHTIPSTAAHAPLTRLQNPRYLPPLALPSPPSPPSFLSTFATHPVLPTRPALFAPTGPPCPLPHPLDHCRRGDSPRPSTPSLPLTFLTSPAQCIRASPPRAAATRPYPLATGRSRRPTRPRLPSVRADLVDPPRRRPPSSTSRAAPPAGDCSGGGPSPPLWPGTVARVGEPPVGCGTR